MKIKSLLLAGLFVVGMASCTNDDIDQNGGGDPLAGYLSLKINSGSMSPTTKTTEHTPGREVGSAAENKINDVTVVLTDAAGVILQIETPSIASGTTTQKFAVSTGSYLVYALVNNPITLTEGANIEQVLTGATDPEITAGYKSGSFFMTNEQSDVTKTVLDAGKAIALGAGDDIVVQINVDRLAAKVRDKTETPNLTELLAKEDVKTLMDGVRVVGFVPMNLNPDMNIFQTWGTQNSEETTALANNVLLTPIHAADSYLLPAITYKTVEDGVGIADLTTEDQYVDSVYVSENRPTIKINSNGVVTAAQQGQTTAVIYRVVAQKGGSDLTETFYAYNGIAYAKLEDLPSSLGDLSTTSTADLRKMGVNVYENGVMYYTYFIKDPNMNYQLGTENYYGTFRNSIYNLNIASIAKLGDDVPDDSEKPTDPVDPEDAKISVELTINDWVLNNINIDF